MRQVTATPSTSPICAPRRSAFTVMELMLVVLIMSIIALLGIDSIADFEASQRADRAARETLAAFRYARSLAMTTGKSAKVSVSTANRTFSIYWMSNGSTWDASPVASGMTSSGQWVLNFDNSRELVGTDISLNPVATTNFIYSALGTCGQTGTVTFSYAGKYKSLIVKNVGDPTLQ